MAFLLLIKRLAAEEGGTTRKGGNYIRYSGLGHSNFSCFLPFSAAKVLVLGEVVEFDIEELEIVNESR